MGNVHTKTNMTSTKGGVVEDSKQSSNKSNVSITSSNGKMDEKNKEAIKVLKEEGEHAFVKHVFTGDNGKPLTYSEMRALYG